MATKRDHVWKALLDVARQTEKFRVDDVVRYVDESGEIEVSRRTIERTLRGAAEAGVLGHDPGSPWYRGDWFREAFGGKTGTDNDRGTTTHDHGGGDDHIEAIESGRDSDETNTPERVAAVVDEVAANWSDDRLSERREAAVAALAYVVNSDDPVSKSELIDEIEPEHPVTNQSPRTWFRQNVRPVFNEIGTYSESIRAHTATVDDLPATE